MKDIDNDLHRLVDGDFSFGPFQSFFPPLFFISHYLSLLLIIVNLIITNLIDVVSSAQHCMKL